MVVSNTFKTLFYISTTVTRKCKPTFPVRAISTTSVVRSRSLVNFKKLQSEYQCDDGKPIFLKRGFMDRLLYSTTIVLCFIGVFNVLIVIYDHAKPNSWKAPK